MSRILAVLCLVAAVSATGNLVGTNKCTWGPSYWCSGANAANECGALSYCQAQGLLLDVTADLSAPSPAECKLCKMVVGAVVEKVGSNATEQEVEKVLDSICDKLGGFKGPCDAFVTKYTPELMAILVDDLNATSVCQKLGLCPKADGTFLKASPVECKLCQLVVGKVVANLTSNSTEQEIEAELEKVCNKMGGLAGVCTDFVEKYTPELIAILAQDLNATSVCQKLGLCPKAVVAPAPAVDASPVECKLCQLVVGKVVANLTSNSTEQEIEAELEKVCNKMGGLAGVCTDFVEKYTPELIAILAQDLNATSVCQKIGMCPNSTLAVAPVVVAQPSVAANPGECKLCMYVIGQIDTKLDSNSTVEEVEAALDKVCSKLGAFGKICDDLVTKYTPELVATLVNDLNATRVCKKIGACPNVAAAPAPAAADLPFAVSDTLTFAGALGTQACTEGPSYWCSSKAAATKCNAVAHCEATVWAQFGAPQ